MKHTNKFIVASAGIAMAVFGGAAAADTIDPVSYVNNDLAVGDSVTIRKTVVVEAAGTSSALLDVMFLIDNTGSMGAEIEAAKDASAALLSGLSATFGDVASGTGFINDPLFDGVYTDLTTDASITEAAINEFSTGSSAGPAGGTGGDFPEQFNAAIEDAASNASWRTGSNRFAFVLGDASTKNTPPDAEVIAALAAENVTLIGLNFGGGSSFAGVITSLGGEVFDSSASAASIIADVTAGITDSFAEYTEVTVGDLGGGAPLIDVSAVCVSADTGACVGADAVGDYDRSVDRTFEYDVTFTRLAAGDSAFTTFALVDGGAVAKEADRFGDGGVPAVPLPAAGWLLIASLGGLAAMRRKKAA